MALIEVRYKSLDDGSPDNINIFESRYFEGKTIRNQNFREYSTPT